MPRKCSLPHCLVTVSLCAQESTYGSGDCTYKPTCTQYAKDQRIDTMSQVREKMTEDDLEIIHQNVDGAVGGDNEDRVLRSGVANINLEESATDDESDEDAEHKSDENSYDSRQSCSICDGRSEPDPFCDYCTADSKRQFDESQVTTTSAATTSHDMTSFGDDDEDIPYEVLSAAKYPEQRPRRRKKLLSQQLTQQSVDDMMIDDDNDLPPELGGADNLLSLSVTKRRKRRARHSESPSDDDMDIDDATEELDLSQTSNNDAVDINKGSAVEQWSQREIRGVRSSAIFRNLDYSPWDATAQHDMTNLHHWEQGGLFVSHGCCAPM